ncbi:hypothetical protein EJ03DRAFT_95956 [Teratosphaeria nubilosa]|uniref:Uncharacterized protein n=1 Tax=Teratosphaeria nubilosa TaxID=161662 RepID=A0A6G1L9Y9_9PEZI|nr:hypothetical protein EJ03DRAFT_95956 [Teratosphaeria nubilosa]
MIEAFTSPPLSVLLSQSLLAIDDDFHGTIVRALASKTTCRTTSTDALSGDSAYILNLCMPPPSSYTHQGTVGYTPSVYGRGLRPCQTLMSTIISALPDRPTGHNRQLVTQIRLLIASDCAHA